MKTGINVDCTEITDVKRSVARIIDNGFETSFIMAEDAKLPEFAAEAKIRGLKIETLHAPFASDGECYINDMWSAGEKSAKMAARLNLSAEKCAALGIPYLVTHLSSGENAPRVNETGLDNFYRLVKRAKELGVIVAFENQRKLGNLVCALEYFPEAGFCFDVGHQNCFTPGNELLPLLGNRLVTVHIHDNLKEKNGDLHRIPFDGAIDYNEVVSQFNKHGYKGPLMLEVFKNMEESYDTFRPYENMTDDEYVGRAGIAAKKLKTLFEKA